jgi:hypothetical protein
LKARLRKKWERVLNEPYKKVQKQEYLNRNPIEGLKKAKADALKKKAAAVLIQLKAEYNMDQKSGVCVACLLRLCTCMRVRV